MIHSIGRENQMNLLVPVVGFSYFVDINDHNIEELFQNETIKVIEAANIIMNELRDNKLTTSDKIIMYSEAFTIGAISTVIGQEFGKDLSKAFKEAAKYLFRE